MVKRTRFKRHFSHLAAVAFAAALAPLWVPAEPTSFEYEIKAAFLYNFAKFVEWPATPMDTHLNLCVLGEDPFGGALESLAGREVGERTIRVRRIRQLDERGGCAILFVAGSESAKLQQVLSILHDDKGLLSVSDINNFAAQGGIIELLLDGNKVRFAINLAAANRAGLTVSSKLLQLARLVEGD